MTPLLLPERSARLSSPDVMHLVPLLMVVVILVKTVVISPYWHLKLATETLCLSALVFASLRQSPVFWTTLAAVLGWTVFSHWEEADNHQYLFCYAALALAAVCSLPASQQRRGLRIVGQVTLGLCMGFSVWWKAITPDYLTGAFFEYALLTDERFAFFAEGLARIPGGLLAENRQLEALLHAGQTRGIVLQSVTLASSPRVELLAQFLTWWTIGIEGLLAVLFLLPGTKAISFVRNGLLLGFAVTTYAVATVFGFAWVLLILGLAQCRDDEPRFARLYLLTFLLIAAYKTIPTGHLIALTGAFSS